MSADGAVDLHLAQPLDPEDALAVVRAEFGLAVDDPITLGGEFDQNLRVTDALGGHYLVKVTTLPDSDPSTAAWHERILLHLHDEAPELPMPRVVPTPDGRLHVIASTPQGDKMIRVLSWLTGAPLAEEEQHSDELLTELGAIAGRVSNALTSMPPPTVPITHDWDMRRARDVVDSSIDAVTDPGNRADVAEVMSWFDVVEPLLAGLPRGVAHQDLNDSNILVDRDASGRQVISGVLDVNDALDTVRVAELAVATAYALVRKDDPLHVARLVVAGFDAVTPLTDDELAVVFPLAAARLAMNATTWTQRNAAQHNDHGVKRMKHTWPALAKVARIDPDYAEAALRQACGRPAHPDAARLDRAVRALAVTPWSAEPRPATAVDTATGSDLFDVVDWHDATAVAAAVDEVLGARTAGVGVVGHLRTNLLWSRQRGIGAAEPRTITLGTRLLVTAGEVIASPLDGVVEFDSPTIRHTIEDDEGRLVFRTHWNGLSGMPASGPIAAGQPLGTVTGDDGDGLGAVVHVSISLPRRHRDGSTLR